MTDYGRKPWVYAHSVTQHLRGRPPVTGEGDIRGLSDECRWLLNIMMGLPERWFIPSDFAGNDPHRYTKLTRLWKRGLIERRERGTHTYEYRFHLEGSEPPSALLEDGA